MEHTGDPTDEYSTHIQVIVTHNGRLYERKEEVPYLPGLKFFPPTVMIEATITAMGMKLVDEMRNIGTASS